MGVNLVGKAFRQPVSSKPELLAVVGRMRADVERLVAEAGPTRMELVGVTSRWSLKDLVAHLTAWRWWSVARLEGALRDEEPAPPWHGDLDESREDDVDRINQQFYEAARDKSTPEVLRESRASFDRMEEAVLALPDGDLFRKGRYAWLEGYSAADVVLGSAAHLFEEHWLAINIFLARTGVG